MQNAICVRISYVLAFCKSKNIQYFSNFQCNSKKNKKK